MSEPEPLKHAISGNEDEESVDDPAKPAPSKLRQILASKKVRNGAALAALLVAGTTLGAVLGTKAADAKKSESAAVESSAAADFVVPAGCRRRRAAANPKPLRLRNVLAKRTSEGTSRRRGLDEECPEGYEPVEAADEDEDDDFAVAEDGVTAFSFSMSLGSSPQRAIPGGKLGPAPDGIEEYIETFFDLDAEEAEGAAAPEEEEEKMTTNSYGGKKGGYSGSYGGKKKKGGYSGSYGGKKGGYSGSYGGKKGGYSGSVSVKKDDAEGAAAPEEEETTTDADKCEAIDALRKEGKAILPGGRRRRDLADRRDVAAEGGPANGPKIRGRRLEEEEAAKGEPATKKALERDLIFDLGADLEAQSMSLDYSASTVHSACGPETCGDGLECLEIPVFDKYACVTSRVVQCMVEDEAGAVDCCVEQV